MTDAAPLPVIVTGLTDRSSVIRMLGASLESAGLFVPVFGLDPAEHWGAETVGEVGCALTVVTTLGSLGSTGDGMETRRALAELLKRSTAVVLDADELVSRELARSLGTPITWTSRDPRNPLVLDHLDRGGDACIFEEGALRLCAGGTRKDIAAAAGVPALLGGAARRPLASALRGVGAAVALGLGLEQARAGLEVLRGPRYVRREGVQVLADQVEDPGSILESVRTLVELPAERRLLWRRLGELDGAVYEPASAAGVEVVDGIELAGLLRETRAGDALLVLTGPEPGTVTTDLDGYEAGTASGR